MQRPHILVPLPSSSDPDHKKFAVRHSYMNAISQAGGEPLCIVRPDTEELLSLLKGADGILLVGGCDIDPEYYREKNAGQSQEIDHQRDRVELSLVAHAREQGIPLLGICRGMQIINVAFGGSLYQDIATLMPGAEKHYLCKDEKGNDMPRNYLAHGVTITEGSLLSTVTERTTLEVNSLHHQGVHRLGSELRASAHAPDGLVEAIELSSPTDHPFLLGVEWHPEELKDEPSQQIFAAFIAAAQTKK